MVDLITEEEMLKKVDQLCKDVFRRMIYGPSQEEEQMIKDIWLKKPNMTERLDEARKYVELYKTSININKY